MSAAGCGAGLSLDGVDLEFAANCLKWDATINAAAWIDPDPTWTPSDAWIRDLYHLVHVPSPMPERFVVKLRLRLPGGHPADEARLCVEYRRTNEPADSIFPYWRKSTEARVTVMDPSGFRRWHTGTIDSGHTEMQRAYVAGLPSALAERLAIVVRAIAQDAPTFVLDESDKAQLVAAINPHRADADRCISCGRVLRDEVSKALGIGPDCANALGVPHTLSEAGRVLNARAKEVPCEQK